MVNCGQPWLKVLNCGFIRLSINFVSFIRKLESVPFQEFYKIRSNTVVENKSELLGWSGNGQDKILNCGHGRGHTQCNMNMEIRTVHWRIDIESHSQIDGLEGFMKCTVVRTVKTIEVANIFLWEKEHLLRQF